MLNLRGDSQFTTRCNPLPIVSTICIGVVVYIGIDSFTPSFVSWRGEQSIPFVSSNGWCLVFASAPVAFALSYQPHWARYWEWLGNRPKLSTCPDRFVRIAMLAKLGLLGMLLAFTSYVRSSWIDHLKQISNLADLINQQRANVWILEQESLGILQEISPPGHDDRLGRVFATIARQRDKIHVSLDRTFSQNQVEGIKSDLNQTDQTISKIEEAISSVLALRHEKNSNTVSQVLNQVTALCQEFYEKSHRATKALTKRIESELVQESYDEYWLGLGGYVLLLASYLLILEPTVFALRRQYRRLKSQSQELTRLAMVAKHTSNMVIITGSDRKITWVNEVFERVTGYSLAMSVGKAPGDLLQFEGTDPKTITRIRECLNSGTGFRGEILNRTRDGRPYWVDLDIQPIIVDGSIITGFIAIENDISRQIEDRNAIKLISDRLLLITEGSSDGLWDWDVLNGGREWWSSRMFELLGYEAGEIEAGLNELFHRVHAEQAQQLWKSVDEAFINGKAIQEEIQLQLRNGEYRWFLIRGKPFFDDNDIAVRLAGMMQDIHDRRMAEKRVTDSKNFLSETLNSLSSPIVILDHRGVIIEVNQAWREFLDERRKQYGSFGIGMGYCEVLTECAAESPQFQEIAARINPVINQMTSQCNFQYQYSLNGQDKWFVIHVTKTQESELSPIVVAHENITEIKYAQNELRQLNDRWTCALEGAGDGVWDWDLSTEKVIYTDRWCEIIGFETDEIGDSIDEWRNRVHADDLGRVSVVLQQFLDNKIPHYAVEHRLRCKDGSWKWILSRGKAFQRDDNGRAIRVVGTHSDISERKELELKLFQNAELLAQSNRSLEEAQSLGRIGSWSYSLQSREFELSKHAGVMLGLETTNGRVDGADILAVIDPDDGRQFIETISDASLSGNSFTLTIKSRHVDSYDHRFYRVEGKVYREGLARNRNLFGTISDVTSEIHREKSLRLAQQRAEEASRIKSEFLANMSHEIRTPMTAIIGFADLLASEVSIGRGIQVLQEHIATIKRNGEHLLALINDILDISKIEAGKMTVENTETKPIAILEEIRTTTLPIAKEKGLELHVSYRSAIPSIIRSDPIRLRQILLNLVSNAIKFTSQGSVSIDVDYDRQILQFVVADSGIGIDKETLDRLFRAFEQADASTTRHYGGTGLGLRISKKLAEALGGDLRVESEVGVGSRFTLTLPTSGVLAQGATEIPSPAAKLNQSSTHKTVENCLQGIRILLAEDGLDNQRLITAHLRRAGADVVVVENGREIIAEFSNDGSPDGAIRCRDFDLLISDMQMPIMDGYEAVSWLRSHGVTIPIIALTAHAMASDEAKCLAAGCTAYLTKPIDREALVSTCCSLIQCIRTEIESADSISSTEKLAERIPDMKPITSDFATDPDMAELVTKYLQGLGPQIQELQQAMDSWEIGKLKRMTHQLKGSGSSYGFPAITDAARKAEQVVKVNSDEATIRKLINELIGVCQAAIQGSKSLQFAD